MKKISAFLLLSTVFFLSTFFVGCKPQEEPIALEDIITNFTKKVVVPAKPIEKPVEIEEQQQIPEIQPEERNKNKRLVIVKVTAEGIPAVGATVTLASKTASGNYLREKQTDDDGKVKFEIPKAISYFYVTAYNDEYAAVNLMKFINTPEDLSPVTIDLNLKEKGVIITAILKNAPNEIKNFNARIEKTRRDRYPEIFVISTNISNNKIVFPSISSKLKNVNVCVSGDNIPQCYSKKFDTTGNKEIYVEIPEKIILKGVALSPDGLPVTNNFSVTAFPADRKKNVNLTGTLFQEQIQPVADGSYELSQVSKGLFNITFRHSDYKPFQTNLYISSPETKLDFSFPRIPTMKLHGIVVYEADNEPVEGITVNAHTWRDLPSYASSITDNKGEFSLELKEWHEGFYGEITVNEPGFGKVIKQIHGKNGFVKIFLKQSGSVIGRVMTKEGTSLSDIKITLSSIRDNENNVKGISVKSDKSPVFYKTTSDSDGNYKFENINAPAKYRFRVYGYNNDFSLPTSHIDDEFTVEVKPKQTATCDLILQKNAVLALKAEDDKGNPILTYELIPKIGIKNGMSFWEYKRTVDVLENDWFFIPVNASGAGTFSCEALETEKGLSLTTNGIPFVSAITNYITLIFNSEKLEPNLTGFLFNPDGSPAKSARIRIWKSGKGHANTSIDNSGYFELYGLKVKKGEMMNVEANSFGTKMHIYTNLPSGSKNVKLRLNLPYTATGKVFLDNLDTPAENFIVSLGHENQSYHSQDGSFVFTIKQTRNNIKKGSVTISVEKYLPGFGNYNFTDKNTCDVGNIILKSGETAKIHGRVVNQNDKPIDIRVGLWCSAAKKSFTAFSSSKDGSYAFDGVPPGMAKVSAQSRLGFKDSHEFEVKEGDDLELPDLVLNYTNSALVTLTFKLPNGDVVTNTRITNKNFYIRQDGKLRRAMRAGIYSDWKIKYNGKNYIANEFEITENTDELEVWLQEE